MAGGSGNLYLSGIITNLGVIQVARSDVFFNGTGELLVNQLGGVMDLQGDFGIGYWSGNMALINRGTIRKTAGQGSASFASLNQIGRAHV